MRAIPRPRRPSTRSAPSGSSPSRPPLRRSRTVRILGIEGPDIHLEGLSITGWTLAAQLEGATHLRLAIGEDGGLGTGCTGVSPYDEAALRALVDPGANETDRLSVFAVDGTLSGTEE